MINSHDLKEDLCEAMSEIFLSHHKENQDYFFGEDTINGHEIITNWMSQNSDNHGDFWFGNPALDTITTNIHIFNLVYGLACMFWFDW